MIHFVIGTGSRSSGSRYVYYFNGGKIMNSGLVVLMGLGVVFIGLVCIIFVCKCMSFVVSKIEKAPTNAEIPASQVASQNSTNTTANSDTIPSRPELAAAIAAAVAEYTGKDISGIRIHSIKKL